MIRILVVEDSPTTQELIVNLLNSDPEITVVGTALNGLEATRLAEALSPDLITMDANMPVMNGLEATRRIMEVNPVPIVIVSASTESKDVANTFQAIEAGAVTLLDKPVLGDVALDQEFLQTIKLMAEVKVVGRRHRAKARDSSTDASSSVGLPRVEMGASVIVIGASTGGPQVLRTILSQLKQPFPLPILIVQHMTNSFVAGFSEWLGESSGFPVRIAKAGERFQPGVAYVGPPDHEFGILKDGTARVLSSRNGNPHCPSVGYLFKTAAENFGKHALGILLTGMGTDGANELKLLKDAGALTFAQDSETSIVHGMPGEAIRLDAVRHILTPEAIAHTLNMMSNQKLLHPLQS